MGGDTKKERKKRKDESTRFENHVTPNTLSRGSSSKQWFVRGGFHFGNRSLEGSKHFSSVLPLSARGSEGRRLLASRYILAGKGSLMMSKVDGRSQVVLRNNSKLHGCLCIRVVRMDGYIFPFEMD
ncbi:hypothetical protein TNCV_2485491 [Trichonephila clavipes]|uniref:Uncharacterized protein n=1 Tax=Trichonephila clavipes TaxID=2585209 RepID=A0A8X7BC92_TRICX|nr:hypothetical protein TNCV_2485491 [Trichonephila clavipes]